MSVMSYTAKLHNRLLLSRLQPVLDPYLCCEQNGFRPRRGTATCIFSLSVVSLKRRASTKPPCLCLCRPQQGFYSVTRDALPLVLGAYHVSQRLVTAIMALYKDKQGFRCYSRWFIGRFRYVVWGVAERHTGFVSVRLGA
jgi:hypothetical protein